MSVCVHMVSVVVHRVFVDVHSAVGHFLALWRYFSLFEAK